LIAKAKNRVEFQLKQADKETKVVTGSWSQKRRGKMSRQQFLQQVIGVLLVGVLLVGCESAARTPLAEALIATSVPKQPTPTPPNERQILSDSDTINTLYLESSLSSIYDVDTDTHFVGSKVHVKHNTDINPVSQLKSFLSENSEKYHLNGSDDLVDIELYNPSEYHVEFESSPINYMESGTRVFPKIESRSFTQSYRGIEFIDKITALAYENQVFTVVGEISLKSNVKNRIDDLLRKPILSALDAQKYIPAGDPIGNKDIQISNGLWDKVFFTGDKIVRAFVLDSGKIAVIDVIEGELAWIQDQTSFPREELEFPRQESEITPTRLLKLNRSEDPFWFSPINPPPPGTPVGWIPNVVWGPTNSGGNVPTNTIDSTIIAIDVENSVGYDGVGDPSKSYGILGRNISYPPNPFVPYLKEPDNWDPTTAIVLDPSHPLYLYPSYVPIYGNYILGSENRIQHFGSPSHSGILAESQERYETLFTEAAKALEITYDPTFL